MLSMLKALYAYRGFVLGNIKREFQAKYRNSLLGASWNILNPLAMILIYTVIFSQVMRTRLPGANSTFAYSIYLCAGLLTWGLFAEIVGKAQNVFLENANLLKKMSFPRLCLPVTVLGNALLNFSIIFGLFTFFLLITGNFPGFTYFAIIPVLLVLVIFGIGLGITIGVLNVFFRDVGQFFGIFLQFWFWLTPIVYPPNVIPERFRPLLELNPMSGILAACQGIFVDHKIPEWDTLMPALACGVVLCMIGMRLFRKHAGEMVDEL